MGVLVFSRAHIAGYVRNLSFKFIAIAGFVSMGLAGGCQYQEISPIQLEIHQSKLNKQGLTPLHIDQELKITCAPPDQWDTLARNRNLLYVHQQWRSPNRHVGMGIAYTHTLVPVSPQSIIWLARQSYAKDESKAADGHLSGETTDSLGRCWFEGEDSRYHVMGYAMTRGCDAWIVYSGYRLGTKASAGDIALAAKAAQSVAPLTEGENDKVAQAGQ